MADGKTLLFNRNGRIEKIPATGGTPQVLDTGFANSLQHDHGISPTATQLVISDNSQRSIVACLHRADWRRRASAHHAEIAFVLHGWSPDGKTLAFVGERNGDFDIYAIPASGGEESKLTTAKGLDDGPEYSPDGKYIYFNFRTHRAHADLADARGR